MLNNHVVIYNLPLFFNLMVKELTLMEKQKKRHFAGILTPVIEYLKKQTGYKILHNAIRCHPRPSMAY